MRVIAALTLPALLALTACFEEDAPADSLVGRVGVVDRDMIIERVDERASALASADSDILDGVQELQTKLDSLILPSPDAGVVALIERLGAAAREPDRAVDEMVREPLPIETWGIYSTDDMIEAALARAGEHFGVESDLSALRSTVLGEVRRFLRDPDNLRLVGPAALAAFDRGVDDDVRILFEAAEPVFRAELILPRGMSADEWCAGYRVTYRQRNGDTLTEDEAALLESALFAEVTAELEAAIPGLLENEHRPDVYCFLARRWAEGGRELVQAYQELGIAAVERLQRSND